MLKVKALLFDVFGTVVDWRTGIAREVESVAKKNNISCLLYTSPSPRDRQ